MFVPANLLLVTFLLKSEQVFEYNPILTCFFRSRPSRALTCMNMKIRQTIFRRMQFSSGTYLIKRRSRNKLIRSDSTNEDSTYSRSIIKTISCLKDDKIKRPQHLNVVVGLKKKRLSTNFQNRCYDNCQTSICLMTVEKSPRIHCQYIGVRGLHTFCGLSHNILFKYNSKSFDGLP